MNISNAMIKTGDDCISIGDGSQQINLEKVTCGPGHGISIGSLGKYKNEKPVSGVTVKNCTISDTMFGVRIKTWPDSPKGIATNLQFDGIVMNNVGTPILIDQQYCPYGVCKHQVFLLLSRLITFLFYEIINLGSLPFSLLCMDFTSFTYVIYIRNT